VEATEQQASVDQTSPVQQDAEFAKLKAKWAIYRPDELRCRCQARGNQRYVINRFVPEKSLVLMVGDSGLGKSPLAYQMALCVAAGVPFLGEPVQQTSALYLDFENGSFEVNHLVGQLSKHLGIAEPPRHLTLWNIGDCKPDWGTSGHSAVELIRDVKPGVVFIDPLTAAYPDMEKTSVEATNGIQRFRAAMRDCNCSVVGLHHRKKPPTPKVGQAVVPTSIEDGSDPRPWFADARGSGVLVNGSDVRLGLDRPGISGVLDGGKDTVALVIRGYVRLHGEIPTSHLVRVHDEAGEALGYRLANGIELLGNPAQEQAFKRLPDGFEFKEAKRVYGKEDQATRDFLLKCKARGILRQVGHGFYEKVKVE
jgi:hypothetical protein